MTQRLFIAEKPSMGRAIAVELALLNKTTAQASRTHIVVGQDIVTWCFGHLLELAPLQAYDPKYEKWVYEDLPVLPEQWKMQIAGDKKDQVNTIKALLKDAQSVVHAGDPGREGQLIVDELLHFFNNKKPVQRILLNALDSQSIQEAFKKLESNQRFQPIFIAGQARSHADFNMGINMTRVYSVLARRVGFTGGVLSIGRVQTPTLSIVVQRDELIEKFKPKDFWVPWATFKVASGQFQAKWVVPNEHQFPWIDEEQRIIDQKAAQSLLDKIKDKDGVIDKFEEKPKFIEAPLPFSLSMMQTYANAKWGVTASDALKICQELYEAKLTSYPRTDCPYLPTTQLTEVPDVMKAISGNLQNLQGLTQSADTTRKSSAWNDKKLSEHHAIIPTRLAAPQVLAGLSDIHRKVYDAIAKRYLAQFFPECEVKTTAVDVLIEKEMFHATGQRLIQPGWRIVYGGATEEEESEEGDEDGAQAFPAMTKGENSHCQDTTLKASKTTPPARFNDGSLIKAMTNVHQLVDDAEMKARLKDVKGIGTEATRANILETLVSRGFIKRDKKALISTPLGRALIHTLPPRMVEPAMTAMWENAFDSIAKAENTEQAQIRYRTFMDKLNAWIRQLVSTAPQSNFSQLPIEPKKDLKALPGHGDTCPSCGQGKMLTREVKQGKAKGKMFLGCSNYPKCSHSIWPK